jgi:hypothetical protein
MLEPGEERAMHATACTMLAEIRIREYQDEVARLSLAQEARDDRSGATGALARFHGQWRAAVARTRRQLALIRWAPDPSQLRALSR